MVDRLDSREVPEVAANDVEIAASPFRHRQATRVPAASTSPNEAGERRSSRTMRATHAAKMPRRVPRSVSRASVSREHAAAKANERTGRARHMDMG